MKYYLLTIMSLISTHFLFGGIDTVTASEQSYCSWEVKEFQIKEPLCNLQGNVQRGRKLVIERKKGNCLACHKMPIPEQDFHGELGPNLAGVGARYPVGMLRLQIVDEKQINPATVMPGFYVKPASLQNVARKYKGKTPLTAQEVEDVVAYLSTLK